MFKRNQPILRGLACVVFAVAMASGLVGILATSAHAQTDDGGAASGFGASQVAEPDIIGGREAVPGAWPWQVGVVNHFNANNFEAQYCGGSLIAPNWVLTAAHCVDGKEPSVIDILVGAHRLSDNSQRVQGDRVIVHPGYDSAALENDLALVRLSTTVTQTPIALYTPVAGVDELRFMRATVIGWGVFDSGGFPDALREVALPLVDWKRCADAFVSPITDNMICAGYHPLTKTACYGDSGGPLMVQDEGGQWLQIGIVSWGPATCVSGDGYDVYTRVGNFQGVDSGMHGRPGFAAVQWRRSFRTGRQRHGRTPYAAWGQAQVHTFHVRGDQDWLKFDVVAGRTYMINTEHEITAAATIDTVVWLYGADGHTPITYSGGRSVAVVRAHPR